jgi:hypothetical protein
MARIPSQHRTDQVCWPGSWISISATLEWIRLNQVPPISLILIVLQVVRYIQLIVGSTVLSEISVCVSERSLRDPLQVILGKFNQASLVNLLLNLALLVLEGFTLERAMGSIRYAAIIALIEGLLTLAFSWIFPGLCYPGAEGLGPLSAALAVIMHVRNVRIFTSGLSLRYRSLPPIEPRWYGWFLLSLMTMGADTDTLCVYAIALLVGSIIIAPSALSGIKARFLNPVDRKALIVAVLCLLSYTVLPFTVSNWSDWPFNGPLLVRHLNAVVRDLVSLGSIHYFMLSPIFLVLSSDQRLLPYVAILIVLVWIYCTLSPMFELPGPGMIALAGALYQILFS